MVTTNYAARLTTEKVIQSFKDVHGDKYDYSRVNYVASGTPALIGCPTHGFVGVDLPWLVNKMEEEISNVR